jgi:Mu-like prophage protein Com.
MNEMKCPFCGKFLGVLDGIAQIKCPRCRRLFTYRSKHTPESYPDQESGKTDAEAAEVP